MPRAFLIAHHRYNAGEALDQKEQSPERTVSIAETRSADIQMSDTSSDCPDELYNLTKLAEVSLAAAAGQILDHPHLSTGTHISTNNISKDSTDLNDEEFCFTYTHKLFDKSSRALRPHLIKNLENKGSEDNSSFAESSVNSFLDIDNIHHENHECADCGKRYSTSSNLARHRQTHRSPGDKKARRCPHCDKLYVSMPAFSMHVRTHNQGCKCHFCGKCFSRPWLLQGHIRTHTGEKPFKCTICAKAFADKSNLRAHVQTHSNTKPHICGRCGKAFALKSYLYKHEESSCTRVNGHSASRETTPDKSMASPTPVIVRHGDSVIQSSGRLFGNPDGPIRSPLLYRSTVISPNPKRILYSTFEHPSVILNASRYGTTIKIEPILQEQPMDFSSTARESFERLSFTNQGNHHPGGYALGLAIAV